jgi:hypothetical protein
LPTTSDDPKTPAATQDPVAPGQSEAASAGKTADAQRAAAIAGLLELRAKIVAEVLAAEPPPDNSFPQSVHDSSPSLPSKPVQAGDPFPFAILSGGICDKIAETAESYLPAAPPLLHLVPQADDPNANGPKRDRRRARYHRTRRWSRETPNSFGHCPAKPRFPARDPKKKWTTFLGQLEVMEKERYGVRGTNADPYPALLQRQIAGQVLKRRAAGQPIVQTRLWIRSDLAESQCRFALFLLRHVDEDSHLVGKPDGEGHIVPYSIDEIAQETRYSRSTIDRRISDYVNAGFIFRWQEKMLVVDETTGEESWVSFASHMRVTLSFFSTFGVSEETLKGLRQHRQRLNGYKNEPGQTAAEKNFRQLAAEKYQRVQQHLLERRGRGENLNRNAIGSKVIASIAANMTRPRELSAQEGFSRIGIEEKLRREFPSWDKWPLETRERILLSRLRPKPSPSG